MENYSIDPHAIVGAKMRSALLITSVLVLSLLVNCSARRSEPIVGALPLSSAQIEEGKQVFMAHCHQCHPGGEPGLGPAINNKPLPAFAIRFQVRQGFGAMPAFSPADVSEKELDAILAYLQTLRDHK
jgi:mono/diheme cytochrome c family protein